MADHAEIHPIDIERGACCMDCGYVFQSGDRYASRLLCVIGDTPCTETVCLGCDDRVTGDI